MPDASKPAICPNETTNHRSKQIRLQSLAASELRRIARRWNSLTSPIQTYRQLPAGQRESPQYQLLHSRYSIVPAVGQGILLHTQMLSYPDEQLEDEVYDFAIAVNHFVKDYLLKWAELHGYWTSGDSPLHSSQLLQVVSDIANTKKHALPRPVSGLSPRIAPVILHTAECGKIELHYYGPTRDAALLVETPAPVYIEANLFLERRGGRHDDTSTHVDAIRLVMAALRDAIPEIERTKLFEPLEESNEKALRHAKGLIDSIYSMPALDSVVEHFQKLVAMKTTNPNPDPDTTPAPRPLNFIEQMVEADNAAKKWGVWPDRPATPRVQTRFPPEPNGYLHIGHAKSILLNYGLAKKYGGKFNLRFDDTNPAKEEQEYVDAIMEDVRWLGADWTAGSAHGGGLYWGSAYFEQMYEWAEELIGKGLAYVCELSAEEVSKRRGTPSVPATSPFRDRPAAESLRLFREMRAGKHASGAMTLRAKIDLASPNFNLRDPVMYRILHEEHHNTGTKWCIYPMYDWAHGFEDSLEGVTHSICTLEFENHRPLYDWFIDAVNQGRPDDRKIHHPQQIEFAKFIINYTILSKRNLLKMVEQKVVSGWDDPRLPTICGYRRRGYTPEAIRAVMEDVGVTKVESVIDIGRLENAIRDDLNKRAHRRMAVLRPLRVVIENWPDGKVDHLDCQNNPEDPGAGSRVVPFSKVIYIEREDFMEEPPKKFFRLSPGREVRLRWAYFITCTGVVKNDAGEVVELRATHDPATRGGDAPDGRKVKATLHWVAEDGATRAQVRLFDRLFKVEEPGKATGNFLDDLNPASLEVVQGLLEPSLAEAKPGERFQFERLGYFCVDKESNPGAMVFNRTVTLKDTWAKARDE